METEGNLERAMCFRVSEESQAIFGQKFVEASPKNFMKNQWILLTTPLIFLFSSCCPPQLPGSARSAESSNHAASSSQGLHMLGEQHSLIHLSLLLGSGSSGAKAENSDCGL